MTVHQGFRKFVCWMAKPIPARKPLWPFILGPVGIGIAWTFLPFTFLHPFQEVPLFKTMLASLPMSNYLPYILAYGFPLVISFVCLMPICKGLQLLEPDEFDQYNDEE